jgi:hypothetical protein
MRIRGISSLAAVTPAVIAMALASTALAQNYERAPTFAPNRIPGIKPSGINYTIKNPVRSDGLFRIYVLATPYGDISVQGDQMLRMRIKELEALDQLEKISQSDQFSRALVNAGLSPVKYAGKLITNPIGTISGTFAGVGSFLGSVSSGIANAGKTQDDTIGSLIGVTKERRQLAAKVGVDPYTDLAPLAEKLKALSEAAALGGLAVTGAMMAIPGAAGIVVSNLSTANTLGDMNIEELAQRYTAAQILDLNRKRLAAHGVDSKLIEAFLSNRNYTPIDTAVISASLESMPTVQNRVIFIERAATANSRAVAYFNRRQAEMIAHFAKSGGFTRFESLGGYPFLLTRDGRVVGLMPFDAVSWTESIGRGFGNVSADMKRVARGGAEMRITGQATALAKQRLGAQGWKVVENVRF